MLPACESHSVARAIAVVFDQVTVDSAASALRARLFGSGCCFRIGGPWVGQVGAGEGRGRGTASMWYRGRAQRTTFRQFRYTRHRGKVFRVRIGFKIRPKVHISDRATWDHSPLNDGSSTRSSTDSGNYTTGQKRSEKVVTQTGTGLYGKPDSFLFFPHEKGCSPPFLPQDHAETLRLRSRRASERSLVTSNAFLRRT